MAILTNNGSSQGNLFGFGPDSGEFFGTDLDQLTTRLDHTLPGPTGYVLHRLLLVNYWHFDYEEIIVPHGRLFLLGENGSGKSTILGATLPLLLDGSIRPERLDTFGSTHRKIDHYVLGQQPSGATYQRRTSYVALEFAWQGQSAPSDDSDGDSTLFAGEAGRPRFLTIGICFAGNADAKDTVRPYRFILTSGHRIGYDLPLKDRQGHVYDAAYFRSIVREHGEIAEQQGEYRDLVARHLFGYRDGRSLEHLVEVLLLLRKPGLSNELHTFSDVSDYVKRALPPLPEDITQNTTEAFERIDELRHQETRLQRQADACTRIHEADLTLARSRAYQRALPVVEAASNARRRHAEVAAKQRALAEAERSLDEARKQHARIEENLVTVRQAISNLEGSVYAQEAAQLEGQLRQAESQRDLTRQLLAERERTLTERQRAVAEVEARLDGRVRAWASHHATTSRLLTDLGAQAAAGRWLDGEQATASLRDALAGCVLTDRQALDSLADSLSTDVQPRIDDRRQRIANLQAEVGDHERAVAAEEQAISLRRARKQAVDLAEHEADEATRALACSWDELAQRLDALRDATVLAELNPTAWTSLFAAAARRERGELGVALAELASAVQALDERAAEEHQRLSQEIGQIQQTLAALDAEIERLRREPDLDPTRRAHREQARVALRAADLDARPLYALVDFAPALSEERRGQVERMLDDAGLLDALVLRDGDIAAADDLLRSRGLADCRVAGASPTSAAKLLDEILVVDATVTDAAWRSAAESALRSIAYVVDAAHADAGAEAQLHEDGSWRHGLLAGFAGGDGPLGFIGAANRKERRQREIDRRLAERAAHQRQLAARAEERERLRQEQSRRRADLEALRRAAADREIVSAEVRLLERSQAFQRAQEEERAAAAEVRECAEQRLGIEARLSEHAMPLLGVAVPERSLIQAALSATHQMAALGQSIQTELERLSEIWAEHQRDRERQAELADEIRAAEASRDEGQRQVVAAEESVRQAQERLESSDVREFQQQLAATRAREQSLNSDLLGKVGQLGSLETKVETLQQAVGEATNEAATADSARAAAIDALLTIVRLSSDVADGIVPASEDDVVALAERWCPPSTTDQEQLDRAADQARERRRAVFDDERAILVDYNLTIANDERNRVVVHLAGQEERSMVELLRVIQQQIQDNQLLLTAEEEHLFKDYLCDIGLSAIHKAVQQAEQLVWGINDILGRTRLGGERYELKLEPVGDYHELSTPLARHHALFRKDPATITDDERKVLLEAVRGAVAEARSRVAEEGGVFADLLTRAFDYREWYNLQLIVTDANGQRQRITSRTARTRSGAQQLFALYVPLFAALAALYHTAQPWAPKLFTMDEAFDKVSEDNVVLLLRFLVDLGFQWIVASPRLSGAGRDVLPACADWQLYHNATEQLAQAIPLIYYNGELLDENGLPP